MKPKQLGAILLCYFLFGLSHSFAQTSLNPDISVIPRFRVETNDGAKLPAERKFSRPEFTLEEFELAVQAYLNPYARADIFLAKRGVGTEPIEIEEAYATFLRGLPGNMNIRIGKYLAEYGKLNSLHPHAWPFLTKPLSLERFLGEEGINDLGLSVSFLIPTGDVLFTRFNIDVLAGNTTAAIDPHSGNLSGGPGYADTLGGKPLYANAARLMTFFPVSENSDIEIGLSGLTGIHDPYNNLRFYYGNFDFKFKWKPSSYTSLVLQGEALLNTRNVATGTNLRGNLITQSLTSSGFYVYGDYQFQKIFTIGTRYDWSQSPYSKEDKAEAIAIFFGYYPVEETTAFRLQYQHTRTNVPGTNVLAVNSIALQFMFSMGPHKAHPF
ncbi:MAG: hypothetical protein HY088_03700 [Ignavibacteriales bacterium]|nr:hypothetical protein [Ignavibacteriales bacterium]